MADFEPKQFGKYFLIEKLATGGMAEIYKAKTFGVDGFEKLLVIKRILPHCSADKEFITMLTDEAKLSVLLSHANIVQVYDLGKVGDDYFISMEYISGVNLREITYKCRELNRPLETELAVFITSEMCKGLDYAHRKADEKNNPLHIVHRDISPQNILISYEGEVKIVDFGIAKAAMNISHTMAGILKGKIAYMSPEQASGHAIDSKTDIFSTGILLYEMLTNTKLFTGESQFEVLQKIRTASVTKGKLPASIPEPLKEILIKALASNPDERYQTAGDMQIDLTRFLYVTYPEFTPRKLVKTVKEIFQAELKKLEFKSAKIESLEQQTSSMNMEEGEKQENIVHGQTPLPESKSITAKEELFKEKKIGFKLPLMALAIAILTGLVGWFGYKYFTTPRPATPKVTVPVQEFGSAKITSNPAGALVFINDQNTGLLTPTTIANLKVGDGYKLRVEKPKYSPTERSFTVSSTEPMSFDLTLQELPQEKPETKPQVTTPEQKSQPPPSVEKQFGSLSITSDPSGASISINGKSTGKRTPASISELTVGESYKVGLSLKGYAPTIKTYKIRGEAPLKISETLKVAEEKVEKPKEEKAEQPVEKPLATGGEGKLVVKSDPSGANVFVNGDHKGNTPLETAVPAGKLSVLINKDGYFTEKRMVTVEKGKTKALSNISLVKEGELKLTIKSTPAAAEVTLDGARIPPTPVIIKGAGLRMNKSYTVVISKDGYQTMTKTVTMDSAQKEINVYLEKE